MATTILKVQKISLVSQGGGLVLEAEYHACIEKEGMLRTFAAGATYVQVDEKLNTIMEELLQATESALNKSWDLSPSQEAEDPERSLTAPEDEEPL